MKIRLMTAAQKRKNTKTAQKVKSPTMTQVAEQFINGNLRIAIEKAGPGQSGVNVELPIGVYKDLAAFGVACAKILKPLGYTSMYNRYTSIISHDGSGTYDTLYVSWEKVDIR